MNYLTISSRLQHNYEDVLENRKRTPLITYNTYRTEKKKKEKNNPFNVANWKYNKETDSFTCQNRKELTFHYLSNRTDRNGFTLEFKVYEGEDCSGCPFRSQCTKAEEGHNRQIRYNGKWEQQKENIKLNLSERKLVKSTANVKLMWNQSSVF